MEVPSVVVRDVFKTYDTGTIKVEALKGVDLTVERGEMLAIMGPSGCGKTTLLNCMSGLDTVDQGEILIENKKLHELPDDERSDYRARRMGFVFQLYNLIPVLTSVENVEMPLLVAGVNPREARRKSMEQLDIVGLSERAHHLPGELSGGQRQRVTIARALINEPAIVWADEPTGDLDSETTNDIMELMCRLNQENRQTFVMVTHGQDVGDRAHRIVRMRDGIVVDDGMSASQARGRAGSNR